MKKENNGDKNPGASGTKDPVVRSAIGHSVDGDDMQWTVNCPECNREHKCEGYFESTDIDTCKCGCVYRTERVYFEDGSFIS